MSSKPSSGLDFQPCFIPDASFDLSPEPHTTPYNLIDFIAVAQKLKISFLEVKWQEALVKIGEGGSGSITQAFMSLHTSLAFKCLSDHQKSNRIEDDIFRVLINEVIGFSHPALRRNRGVLNLEGICWDIEAWGTVDKIWPTLMFEKSPFGDVYTFLTRPEGKNLSMKERVDLCMGIAWAISDMHINNIVHGDIKPANALIFWRKNRYTAKIVDFGLSNLYTDQDHHILVAGTRPWTAPELNGNLFTVEQAMRMDIFSYGLLVFWVLFEKYLCGEVPLPEESRQISECIESQNQQNDSMAVLGELKQSDNITLLAKQLIGDEPSASNEDVRKLNCFFEKALSHNPNDRVDALETLCSFKELYHSSLPDETKLEQHNFRPSECKFELTSSATDFYTLDYRVRRSIRQLLEQRQATSSDDHTAFQLALCNHIGFGGPREEESLHRALKKSRRSMEELEETVASMKPYERTEERYTGKVYSALERSGQVAGSPAAHTLQEAETAIQQEMKDLERALGKSNRLWLISARKLADIYESSGRWRIAEELRKDLLLTYRTLLAEDHRDVLRAKQNLAHAHEFLDRHEEAQELQRQVVDAKVNSLGKSHEETLKSMSHLAFMYRGTKQWDQAEKLELFIMDERMKVLGEEHEDTLHTMASLARIYDEQDLWEKSRELWVRVVETSRRVLGDKHPYTHMHEHGLAVAYRDREYLQEARELQEQILEASKKAFGGGAHRTLATMAELARTMWRQGARSEAENLLRQVLALTGDSMKGEEFTWTVMIDLAGMLERRGEYAEAFSLHREVLTSRMKVLGRKHLDTIESMRNMARSLEKHGKYVETELMFRDIVALAEDSGTAYESKWADSRELAKALYKQGKYEQAEPVYRNLLAARRANLQKDPYRHEEAGVLQRKISSHDDTVLGKDHDDTLAIIHNLAAKLSEQGKDAEAKSLLQEVLAIQARIKGEGHPSTLMTANLLGIVLTKIGMCEEAEEMLDRNLVLRKKVLGMEHNDTLISMRNLASALREHGKYVDAERISQEEIILRGKKFGKNDGQFLISMNNLAKIYICQGRHVEAEDMLREVVKRREGDMGKNDASTLKMKDNLAEALSGQEKWWEAQQIHHDVLESRLVVLGANHPDTLRSRVNHSDTLSGQGNHQQALLGYEEACRIYRDTLGPGHPDTLACEKHCAHSQRQVNEQTSLHSQGENDVAGPNTVHTVSGSEPELIKMMQDSRL